MLFKSEKRKLMQQFQDKLSRFGSVFTICKLTNYIANVKQSLKITKPITIDKIKTEHSEKTHMRK